MEYKVNIDDIKTSVIALGGQAKVKEIQTYILNTYCHGQVPSNYASFDTFRATIQRRIENYCPEALDFDPNTQKALLNRVGHGVYRLLDYDPYEELHLAEEIKEIEGLFEGATKQISVNVYERNPQARAICIQRHGHSCSVCNFNFKNTYGEIGHGFIHVHHLKPLSLVTETYEVDPIEDLKPVCPNCHAMLHKKNPPYSIEELKSYISENSK